MLEYPGMLLFVRFLFIFILAIMPVTWADSLTYWELQGIININFSEPVVSQEVVNKQYRRDCNASEKGWDLFTIQGDAEHTPRVLWVDRDCLRIEPAPGTAYKTEYCLRFRGDASYLSGRALECREFRFHAPASPLMHEDLRTSVNGGALVAARHQHTAEALNLSPQSGISYTFTRLKMDERGDFFESGETAGAVVEQARMHHINSFTTLQSLALRGGKWEQYTPDMPLPGYVVVRPSRQVPAGSIWRLNAKAAPDSGLADSNLGPIYVNRSLSARLEQHPRISPQGDAENLLEMRFNSLLEREALKKAFREMRLTVDGVETILAEDGETRVAVVDGREVRVQYREELPAPEFRFGPNDVEDAYSSVDAEVRYQHPTAAAGMRLVVESDCPVLVECTLKAGLQGVHGLPFEQDFTCRCSMTPLEPGLPRHIRHYLPLHGKHRFSLETVNGSKVCMRLRHWKASEIASAWPKISSHLEQQNRRSGMALNAFARAVAQKRIQSNLANPSEMPSAPENAERAREVLHNREFLKGCGGRIVAEKEVELATVASRLAGVAPLEVDLEALCGGAPEAGMYLLEMDIHPSAAVQEIVRARGLNVADWIQRRDALVCVSDLAPFTLQGTGADMNLVVLSQRSGNPVSSGSIQLLGEEAGKPRELVQGCAPLPPGEGELLVRQGEDYCLVPAPFNWDSLDAPDDDTPELRAVIWTDRTQYLPGEKVHVRGFLRAVDGRNRIEFSQYREPEIHFEAPDGTRLFSRTFQLDSNGAFSQELTLPQGGQNVHGRYVVKVGTTRPRTLARTEIFCRPHLGDSFAVQVEDATRSLSPEELVFRVKTQDAQGRPIERGQAELKLFSSAPLPGASEIRVEQETRYTLTASAPLAADGTAEFRFPLGDAVEGVVRVEYEGSVINEQEEYQPFRGAGEYAVSSIQPLLSDDNRLTLKCLQCGNALHASLAARVAIRGNRVRDVTLGNGFSYQQHESQELWSAWVNVPAEAAEGIPLQLEEHLTRLAAEYGGACEVEIRGRDFLGKVFKAVFPRGGKVGGQGCALKLRPGGQSGSVELECSQAGRVLLLAGGGNRLRVQVQELQAGRHELPLLENEGGQVLVSAALLQNHPVSGALELTDMCSLRVQRAHPQSALQVTLDLPGTERPGTEQQISGRVTLPDASPAQAVVTLYVLDDAAWRAGATPLPDVVQALVRYPIGNHPKILSLLQGDLQLRHGAYAAQLSPLPGVWQGEGLMPDKSWKHQPWWMQETRSYGVDNLYAASPARPDAPDAAAKAPASAVQPQAVLCANPQPLVLWRSALPTDSEGRFQTTCRLPGVLGKCRVIAVAAEKSGTRFGTGTGQISVNQPLVMQVDVPHRMSVGDFLTVPLALTNNTEAKGTWEVKLVAEEQPRQLTLAPGERVTLLDTIHATQLGKQTFRWLARGSAGEDTTQAEVEVSHPAPLLREARYLVLNPGQAAMNPREHIGAELAAAVAGEAELMLSANPLLFMQGAVDFLMEQPQDSLENMASALLPLLLYDRLAPMCPRLAQVPPQRVRARVEQVISSILQHQLPDYGLPELPGGKESSLWCSAHVAVALRLADERGFNLPLRAWYNLLGYLEKADVSQQHPLTRYQVARALQNRAAMRDALLAALESGTDSRWLPVGVRRDISFLEYLRTHNDGRREAFLQWMRERATDYQHDRSWNSAWAVYSLLSYIGNSPGAPVQSAMRLPDGSRMELGRGVCRVSLPLAVGGYKALQGESYVVLRAQARPASTDYAGSSEHGLQLTRCYEKKAADGTWQSATEFAAGDEVRVTLTCTQTQARELRHLVLEDSLPASMESLPRQEQISPDDRCHFMPHGIRFIRAHWEGRHPMQVSYLARVKRAGSATAPPAQLHLRFEPRVHALSSSTRLETK